MQVVDKCKATTANIAVFWVSGEFVMEKADEFAKVLSLLQFVPTRVEHDFARRRFYYEGISPDFPEIKPGYKPTIVEILISKNDIGEIESVEAVPSEGRVSMYER